MKIRIGFVFSQKLWSKFRRGKKILESLKIPNLKSIEINGTIIYESSLIK